MTRWRDKNPPKPSSHSFVDKHLFDEHPKNDVYSSGHSRLLGEGILTKKRVSDALVRNTTAVARNIEPTKSQYRSLPNVDQTGNTCDDGVGNIA